MIKIKKVGLEDLLPITKKVMEHAAYVSINSDRALAIVHKIPEFLDKFRIPFKIIGEELKIDLQLIFVRNAINFSFWPDPLKPQWVVEKREGHTSHIKWGADALNVCFERALQDGTKVLSPNFLNHITEGQMKFLFRGLHGTEIPMSEERMYCLRNIGSVLLEKFGGKYLNIIEIAEYDAVKLVDLIAEKFSSYSDISRFRSMRVPFLKRAQLCAYHTDIVLRHYGQNGLKHVDRLTAFADYRIPQILREFGILEYSERLKNVIRKEELILRDDPMEVEIRAATIQAVELIRQHSNGKYISAEIDSILWKMTRSLKLRKPFHRTRTRFY